MVPYMIIIPLSGRDNKDASGFQHLGTNCPEVVKTGERHTPLPGRIRAPLKLSDSRYATLDAQYEKEQTELTAEISVLEKAIKSYEKHEKDADRFIALIDKYENFDKLTIAMLNEFIEKILVHERDRKGSIQTTQEVEIYFNFVGRFVPPAFGEVELTPEELEEIRKREERKDRLHQNYLKRKANGKQKEYEERTKAKKKAEIEARKQAIRTEDIARGVFIPVSSLPQLGPRKGA